MLKKLTKVFLLLVAFAVPLFLVLAGNIESGDSAANLEIDNTDVLFVCDGCDVEVSDTEINGLIWGESLGWVNLQPSDGGVFNTRLGVVSGNAWGSISGWVNFAGVFIDPETGEFSGEAFSQNRGPITFECPGSSCVVTTWRPEGCTDPNADNYDETATVDDDSCTYTLMGCMDPDALNYDENAEEDDGSCEYEDDEGGSTGTTVNGCMDPEANNFNLFATVDDGSCLYGDDVPGCMDPESEFFNPLATVSDPEACLEESYGCHDPEAFNYDPSAEIHDGDLCMYDIEEGETCDDPTALNFNEEGICIYSIDETEDETGQGGETFVDGDDNGVPDVLESGEDLINDILNGNENALSINQYVIDRNNTAKILATALLIASLLQTLPFREGNLLFSYFSFYKTRKYWGTVYDSVTKQPLDPAYVTLFDEAGQAVDTSITDIDGRYNFIVGPGKYFLSAQKTDYQFPSMRLRDRNYDELYSHLYFGGEVVIEKEDDIISRNIPMDPLRFNWNEYAKQKTKVTHFYRPWHRTLTILARIVFVLGFMFALWVFILSPSPFSFIVLGLYVLTTVLKMMGLRATPRGYVKDQRGFALSFGIIRVYSEELKREVKHTVIGAKGHYLLLVPNGRYYMTVEQKLPNGSYKEVHKTEAFRVRKGFIAKKITAKDAVVVTEEEKFESSFGTQTKKIA